GPAGVVAPRGGSAVMPKRANTRVGVVGAGTGPFYGRPRPAGHISPIAGTGPAGFAGDGGPATAAELHWPAGVAVDPATGNVAVADSSNGVVRVLAGSSGTFYGQVMTIGDIYTVGGVHGATLARFSGDAGPA